MKHTRRVLRPPGVESAAVRIGAPFAFVALVAVAFGACGNPSANTGFDGGSSSGLGPSSSSSGSTSSNGSTGGGSSGSTSGSSGSGDSSGSSNGGAASSSSGAGSGGSSGGSSGGAGSDGGTPEAGTTRGDAGAAEGGATEAGAGGFDPCPASGNCKILPLGDSITFGSPTNNGGYRVELFTRAVNDNKHITFVGSQSDGPNMVAGVPFPKNSEGHPGWTIAQIDGITTTSMALSTSPQIVLLHIGTNDMCSMSAGAPGRLGQLVDKIVAGLPSSLLAVSSIIPFPACASAVTTYNAAVLGIVQQRANQGAHVIYVEMFKSFPSNGLGSDGIHPNDNIGYPWMGDNWYAAIKQYLH